MPRGTNVKLVFNAFKGMVCRQWRIDFHVHFETTKAQQLVVGVDTAVAVGKGVAESNHTCMAVRESWSKFFCDSVPSATKSRISSKMTRLWEALQLQGPLGDATE